MAIDRESFPLDAISARLQMRQRVDQYVGALGRLRDVEQDLRLPRSADQRDRR
jgi:hypothetical protein